MESITPGRVILSVAAAFFDVIYEYWPALPIVYLATRKFSYGLRAGAMALTFLACTGAYYLEMAQMLGLSLSAMDANTATLLLVAGLSPFAFILVVLYYILKNTHFSW